MTNPDFVTARRLALQSQCRPAPAHWQCPKCDSYYPLGATCGVCDAVAAAWGKRDATPVKDLPKDEPPPSGWRDRPALL